MNIMKKKPVVKFLFLFLLVLLTAEFAKISPVSAAEPSGAYEQNQFYISTFRAVNFVVPRPTQPDKEVYRRIIAANKEAGINLVDNAILSRSEMLAVLDVCEEQQIKCLAQNITEDNGFSGMGTYYPEFTETSIQSVVNELSQYTMLEGYYLWDEVTVPHFGVLNNLKGYFTEYDPEKLKYSIVLPSYGQYTWDNNAYANYLNSYIETVNPDVLGFDYYPFSSDHNASLINNNLWRDLGLFREKSMETNKPLWFYFQGIDLNTGDTGGWMNRQRISTQMYSALAYGAKTVSYYTSLGLITDDAGNKTPMFNDIQSLNNEVMNLGNFLFNKESRQMYHFGILPENQSLYYLDQVDDANLIAGAPDKSIVSVFGDSTSTSYVLVVNKDYNNPMTGRLSLKFDSKVKLYNKVDGSIQSISDLTSSIALSIQSGDAALYIIEPADEPAGMLDSFDLYEPNADTGYTIVNGLTNASFTLDAANAKAGTNAGRIDYTYAAGGSVYTGITKNIEKDIADFDAFQCWVKTSVTANTNPFVFQVRFTDALGNMWYGVTSITSDAQGNYVLLKLPLSSFTNATGTIHYNPVIDSTIMKNVTITYIVDGFGEDMSLWLDQLEFTMEPAGMLDSFDLYAPNADTGYTIVNGLTNASFTLDAANAKAGIHAGRIDYTYAAGGSVYTGITKNIDKDIADFDAFQCWVKTSVTANTNPFVFQVRFTDALGNMWYGVTSITSDAQGNYVLLKLPLSSFTNAAGTIHYNPVIDSTIMKNVTITYIVDGFGEDMSLWLDQLEFTMEPAGMLDSFDKYAPNADTGYTIVNGLTNASFTLDAANAKAGTNAGRIDYTYAAGGSVYTGITKNIDKDIADFDAFQCWVKTSVTANTNPFVFQVRFTDALGNMWYGVTSITSDAQGNYVLLKLPLSSFTNAAGTIHYNLAIDSTVMKNVSITYIVDGFGEDMSLWLDQLEFITEL